MTVGVLILAGGEGRRMGGQDKGWCVQNNKTFIEIALQQIQRQTTMLDQAVTIVISANRNLPDYLSLGHPVFSDIRSGYCGPLAGIEAVMFEPSLSHINRWITWPVDSLNVPDDYLLNMLASESKVSFIKQHRRAHYAHLSLSKELKNSLSSYLDSKHNSIKGWLQRFSRYGGRVHEIDMSFHAPITNCNQFESVKNNCRIEKNPMLR
ncbi:NTP transferase domain-containing protein [Hydrogenovibrio sp. 3SP14C1]|uniref:molybdenum cofactor guanylyltransferase n=1 Tax=Hydrogenovibrio sp. 3SP14C1 TaxID=3038774 RepID=UPI00241639ED|nr:NTP transferase domain-containing protein [Hydrogenovibrio sp. 3SP14C1]MDG4813460.1 NTP transferase domain-containing protein [Hydrogenovibrio sp. 3SP14C1]